MGKWPRNDLNANTFFLHVTNQQQWINTMTAIKAAPTYSSTSLLLLFDLFVWQILRFFYRAFLFFAIKKMARKYTTYFSVQKIGPKKDATIKKNKSNHRTNIFSHGNEPIDRDDVNDYHNKDGNNNINNLCLAFQQMQKI